MIGAKAATKKLGALSSKDRSNLSKRLTAKPPLPEYNFFNSSVFLISSWLF